MRTKSNIGFKVAEIICICCTRAFTLGLKDISPSHDQLCKVYFVLSFSQKLAKNAYH